MTLCPRTIEACAKIAETWVSSSWQDEHFAARSIADRIRSLTTNEIHSSDGGGGSRPTFEKQRIDTSTVHEERTTSVAAAGHTAGVAPGPSEASSAGAIQSSHPCGESDPAVTQDCVPAGTVCPSDARTIIAGIRQFGLAADGSDLRDLEAAIERLSHSIPSPDRLDTMTNRTIDPISYNAGIEAAKAEFCARFKAHMLKMATFDKFDDGMTVAEYADETAPTYYDNPDQREDGPEECAESDMSYWGE